MWDAKRARSTEFLTTKLTEPTQLRYHAAATLFGSWCATQGLNFDPLPLDEQDLALGDYGLDLRQQDLPLQNFRDAVAAVQKRFSGRTFKTAWKVITNWQKEKPPHQVPPMSQDILSAMVVVLLAGGQTDAAMATLLCFTGMMRISEALKLVWSDLIVTPTGCILVLRLTKTGPRQQVSINNAVVTNFVLAHRGRKKDSAPICGMTYAVFRRLFLQALRALGCHTLGFKSHSLRRGGATARLIAGHTLSQIMVDGRWSSEASCRLYLKSVEAQLLLAKRATDEKAMQRVRLLSELWPCFVSGDNMSLLLPLQA